MAEKVHKSMERRLFHKDLFSPLVMGAESEEGPQQVVFYRAGDGIWRRGGRMRL